MRLSFEVSGTDQSARLRVRLGAATVIDEHGLPYDGRRLAELAQQVVGVLRRGNRARSLGDAALTELRFLGEELHRALIPPALEAELRRGSGPLLLDLDESLVPIPFELLHDSEGFLCRRYAVGRAVRSTVARRGHERPSIGTPPRALIIAADPRGDLAEVTAECEAIVDVLEREKVRARLLGAGTREQLRRELKDYDIVHFAGHADFLPSDPGGSGWHLPTGKFTASDIAELAGGRPMPLVVFSNACESGRTDGWSEDAGEARRAYGLAGAFLYAGVRHYVGTQWEVIDGHSATFATAFYANLSSGQSIGAAVQHARNAVVLSGGEGALAWASYVLYGDPDDRPLRRSNDALLSIPNAKAIAARESAPWKRPTPQTMKRVGAEIAARRDTGPTKPSRGSTMALLTGAAAGLLVTAAVAGVLWLRRADAVRLALLPVASADDAPGAARVQACLEGALLSVHAPLVGDPQLAALSRSTDVAATTDTRAISLGQALGARWVLWGKLDKPDHAQLRLLDVKTGDLLRDFQLPLDDLAPHCADEARSIAGRLH